MGVVDAGRGLGEVGGSRPGARLTWVSVGSLRMVEYII